MKRLLFGLLILAIVVMSLVTACQTSTSTQSSSTSSTSTSSSTVTTQPTSTKANWWDKFGTPQYGGTISFAGQFMGLNLDVYQMVGADVDFWYESLFEPSWTLDRKTWSMTGMFYPDQYWSGNLADSWTIDSPSQITVKLRQGVHWQNKAPVNGREFVATDVQEHYDRIMGTGGGYTAPSPMFGGAIATWEKVTATDKYTVVFNFKVPSAQNFQTIADRWALNEMEAPEWVALGGPPVNPAPPAGGGSGGGGPPPPPPLPNGPLGDWKQVVGTGPWMLVDFVSGSNLTYNKNPNYWGHDPRYPQNQVPYVDTLKLLIILDSATRLAALRSGQIDTVNNGVGGLQQQDYSQLLKSNPDMQSVQAMQGAQGIGLRVDTKPFTDIRVRKALDMAIDRQSLAKNFYNGASTGLPVGMTTSIYTGYAFEYADWPQSLKDEYTFNPTAAKQLLADAGYPKGFDTNVVTTNDASMLQLMQVFKSYFADIGVNMEIRPMDPAAREAFVRAGKHDQMSGQGLGATFPPTRVIDVYFSTGGTDAIYYGLNNAPDPTYDQLHNQFLAATDPAQAQQIFQQMDKEVITQHFTVAAPESFNYVVWQPWLKGYSGDCTQWGQGIIWSRLWTTKK